MSARLLTLAWLLIALVLLGLPTDQLPDPELSGADLLAHAALFTVGTVLALMGWPQHRLAVIIALLVFAPLAEVWQWVLPTGRHADIYDAAANAVGVGIGWLLFRAASGARKRRTD
jgi:VanZ family protein